MGDRARRLNGVGEADAARLAALALERVELTTPLAEDRRLQQGMRQRIKLAQRSSTIPSC